MKLFLIPRLFYYILLKRRPKFFLLFYLFFVKVSSREPVFLQVGANDGFRFDPIYHLLRLPRVRGVLLEPIETYYRDLCSLHSSRTSRIQCINLAIASEEGWIDLYRVKDDCISEDWMHGIASQSPLHFLKTMPSAESSEILVAERVRAITFEKLFDQFSIDSVDVLVIDVEDSTLKC